MSHHSGLCFLLITGTALAAGGAGQVAPWTYRVELNANAGAGGLLHGDRNWGRGADYGFSIGVRPFVQPYLAGGPGFIRADYSNRCELCVFDVDPITGDLLPRVIEGRTQANKLGLAFAAGVKFALHPRLSIRPELLLVDTTAGSGWNFLRYRFQIGAGFHF